MFKFKVDTNVVVCTMTFNEEIIPPKWYLNPDISINLFLDLYTNVKLLPTNVKWSKPYI